MTSVPRDPGWKNLTETAKQAIESSAVTDEKHEKHEKKLLQEYIDELESIVIESEMRKVRYRYGGLFTALLYLDERQMALVEKLRESRSDQCPS
jgi:hypothetical protein